MEQETQGTRRIYVGVREGYLEGMTFENPRKRSQPLTLMSLIHSRNSYFSALFVSVLVADHGVENEMFLDFVLVT